MTERPERPGWTVIAATPNNEYGHSTLDRYGGVARGLGFHPADVEVSGVIFDTGDEWIQLEVETSLFDDVQADLREAPTPQRALLPVRLTPDEVQTLTVTETFVASDSGLAVEPPAEIEPDSTEADPDEPVFEFIDRPFVCEECGQRFPSKHSLDGHTGAHRRWEREKKTETPVEGDRADAIRETARIESILDTEADLSIVGWPKNEPLLACADCDFNTTTAQLIGHHAMSIHGRLPTVAERTPLVGGAREARLRAAAAS